MKKLILSILISISSMSFAQNALVAHPKVELGLQGLDVGYEVPLNTKLLADMNFGIGGITTFNDGKIGYKVGKTSSEKNFTLFIKGQLRYYLNRESRAERGHSLVNNAGSFIGFQSKFNFNGNNFDVGKSWLNDVHFGQQLPLGRNFIFRYHIGLGYGTDIDFKKSSIYPALGATFGYYF